MLPAGWLGAMVFVLALVLVAWANRHQVRTIQVCPKDLPPPSAPG